MHFIYFFCTFCTMRYLISKIIVKCSKRHKASLPLSWIAVWATSGSLLSRASVTAAFCWTRSQAAPSDGLEEDGFSPSNSSSLSIP